MADASECMITYVHMVHLLVNNIRTSIFKTKCKPSGSIFWICCGHRKILWWQIQLSTVNLMKNEEIFGNFF